MTVAALDTAVRFRLHFIPRRFTLLLFAAIMSGAMSAWVTLALTVLHTGLDSGLPARWMAVWPTAWLIAFPGVAFFAPRIRRLVTALTD